MTKRGRKISQQTGDQSYRREKQTKTKQSEIKGGFYWFTQQEEKAADKEKSVERHQYIQESVKEHLATIKLHLLLLLQTLQRGAP